MSTSASVSKENPYSPDPSADALRLADESPSHTVWVLSKLLPLPWTLGRVSLHMSFSRAVFQCATASWALWFSNPSVFRTDLKI